MAEPRTLVHKIPATPRKPPELRRQSTKTKRDTDGRRLVTANQGRGKRNDISVMFPLMVLNQCGVFSGTITKSPFATCRGEPPSMAVPERLSPLLFSLTSLPPVTSVAD